MLGIQHNKFIIEQTKCKGDGIVGTIPFLLGSYSDYAEAYMEQHCLTFQSDTSPPQFLIPCFILYFNQERIQTYKKISQTFPQKDSHPY